MLRALACAACVLGVAPSVAAQTGAAKIHAVIVGVDTYASLRELHGARNDARDIEQALKRAGAADTILLTDAQATRAAIVEAFRTQARKAAADGGWVVFSYAGHGGQEPERVAGDETDGKDEAFLLGGYANRGAGTAERLVDNDLYALFAEVPSRVRILFIADSCHSGTMTRSIDPRTAVRSTRNASYGPIIDDALPPPASASKGRNYAELPNVVFVASATDSEATVELPIEGQARGAVSWHMARVFSGGADIDGNGATSLSELRQYIGNSARLATENRQHPSVNYTAGRDGDVLPFASRSGAETQNGSAVLPRIGVWVEGGGAADLAQVPAAVAATSRQAAELIWDKAKRQFLTNGLGDVVAEQSPQQSDIAFASGVADKWRALRALKVLRSNEPLTIEVGPNGDGARYVEGTVSIGIPNLATGLQYLTAVNIAGDGTVQWLYPDDRTPAEAGPIAAGDGPVFRNRILPPYGADHVVAIATQRDPAALRASLKALDGHSAASEAYAAIRRAVAGQRHAIGIAGIYTGNK